jgi:hypothetical protein
VCSTGHHCPGFPRVLYNAVIHLGYDGDALVYRCQLSMAHGFDRCEVSVTIPFDPMEPWSGSIISSEPDTGVEMVAHIAHTSLCEKPVWQQRLEVMSDLEGPHFHAGMTSMARYAQFLFNLQHNTARTGIR